MLFIQSLNVHIYLQRSTNIEEEISYHIGEMQIHSALNSSS